MTNWLRKYKEGGKAKPLTQQQRASIQQDQYNQFQKPDLGLPPLDPNWVALMQNRPDDAHITSAGPRRSAGSKAMAVVRNPMTAASYKLQGKELPDYFDKGERNAYDHALDVVNPMTYLDAAGRTASLKHFRDEGFSPDAIAKTLLDAGMIYGVANEFELGTKSIANPLGNKSVYNSVEAAKLKPMLAEMKATGQTSLSNTWKRSSPEWKAYDEQLTKVWDNVPREPIKVPTVGFKKTKSFRVPNESGEYVGTVGTEKPFAPLVNEPSLNIRNSPEMDNMINNVGNKVRQVRATNKFGSYMDQDYIPSFIPYDLQTIEHVSRVIPGITYGQDKLEQSTPQPVNQPYTPYQQPVYNNSPIIETKEKLKKFTNKQKLKEQPVQDTISNTPPQRTKNTTVQWFHSRNGEKPVFDSTRTYKHGGWLNKY